VARRSSGNTIQYQLAPEVFSRIHPITTARRTLAEALTNSNWIDDMRKPITIGALFQVLTVHEEIMNFQLRPDTEDKWTWLWEAKRSAYQRKHFAGSTTCDSAKAIWSSWAPLHCKLAGWLLIKSRTWTADRLAKRGLPRNEKCVFCNSAEEDAKHLFVGCAVVEIMWGSILDWAGFPQVRSGQRKITVQERIQTNSDDCCPDQSGSTSTELGNWGLSPSSSMSS
jgi:hypothetical protein